MEGVTNQKVFKIGSLGQRRSLPVVLTLVVAVITGRGDFCVIVGLKLPETSIPAPQAHQQPGVVRRIGVLALVRTGDRGGHLPLQRHSRIVFVRIWVPCSLC